MSGSSNWITASLRWLLASQYIVVIKNASQSVGYFFIFGVAALLVNQFVEYLKTVSSPEFVVLAFTFGEYCIVVLDIIFLVSAVAIHSIQYLRALWRKEG